MGLLYNATTLARPADATVLPSQGADGYMSRHLYLMSVFSADYRLQTAYSPDPCEQHYK